MRRLELLGWPLLWMSCVEPSTPDQTACEGMSCVRVPTTSNATPQPTPSVGSQSPTPMWGEVAQPVAREPDAAPASLAPDAGSAAFTPAAQHADAAGAPTMPNPESTVVIAQPTDEAQVLFDPMLVRTYELSIAPVDLASIDANPAAEVWVNASLTVDGQTLAVGARYKGSVGAFLMPCTAASAPGAKPGPKIGRCSMKIAFDHTDPNARFHGLRKLNLHAMGRDSSLLRERLGYSLLREMGIAGSRAVHARLVVNGVFQGVFLAVEEIDGRFTRARFGEGGEGNLYKQVWPIHDDPNQYAKALESNRGASPDVTRMTRFKAAIDANDESADRWLDLDYHMRWVAVDRVIMNDDGAFHWYCYSQGFDAQGIPLPAMVRNHNFYWYEASGYDRMWLIPWDLDNSFVTETARVHIDPEWADTSSCQCKTFLGMSQRPAACDPLFARWRALATEREAAIDAFIAGPFSVERVETKLQTWSGQIAPLVQETNGALGAPDMATWLDAVMQLRQNIDLARANRGYPYP